MGNNETITLSDKELNKESNDISISSFSLQEIYKFSEGVESQFKKRITYFYSLVSEKSKQNNSLNFVSNMLDENKFEGENLTEAIISILKEKILKDDLEFKDIEGFGIENGILKVKFHKIGNGDLYYSFDLSAQNKEDLYIKNTRKELAEVKEDVESNISSYVIGGTIFTLTFGPSVKYDFDRGNKFLKHLLFTENGTKYSIDINEILKENFKEIDLINILEKKGVEFNPGKNKFEFKNKLKYITHRSLESSLKNWGYKDYLKEMSKAGLEDVKTEAEFKQMKRDAKVFIEETRREFLKRPEGKIVGIKFGKYFESKLMKNIEKVGGKSMHYILLPIFIQELHKHSGTQASFLASATEVVGFMGGARVGGTLVSKVVKHPLAVLAGSLIAGGVGAVLGEEFLHHIDKKIFNYFPNKDIEASKKSFDLHYLSGGGIYDFMDAINFDFADNFIGMSNNVNLGISPEFYLAKRGSGIKHWNKEVDEYKLKVNDRLDEFLSKEFKYTDVLKDKSMYKTFKEYILSSGYINHLNSFLLNENESNKSDIEKLGIDIFEFLENNLDKDKYLGDNEYLSEIQTQLKKYLLEKYGSKKNIISAKTLPEVQINKIIGITRQFLEKDFIEGINDVLGIEGEGISKMQQDILLKTKNTIYGQYKFYKEKVTFDTGLTVSVSDNKTTIPHEKEQRALNNEAKSKNNLIINLVNKNIDKSKINSDYINKYKIEVKQKEDLFNLAFDGLLSYSEGKYKLGKTEYGTWIPKDVKGGGVKYDLFMGNFDDLIYVSNLSEDKRRYLKVMLQNIIEGNDIVSDKPRLMKRRGKGIYDLEKEKVDFGNGNNLSADKFNEIFRDKEFYNFYKRMLSLATQKNFIKNIEKFGDAVEWDLSNSKMVPFLNKTFVPIIENISDSVDYILSTKTIKEMNFDKKN